MRLLKILLWVGLLLVLVAGGLLIAARYVDWNSYRPAVNKMVREATGRNLSIQGELDFTLFPTPRLSAGGLRFDNAPWGSKAPMIEASTLSFTILPRALLSGELRLRSIDLKQASLLLESDADGRGNWEFGGAGDDGGGLALFEDLASIGIDGLEITWQPHGGKASQFSIDTARLSRPLTGQGVDFSASGSVDGNPITLDGKMSSLAAYLQGQGIRGKVKRSSPKLEMELEGEFGRLPALDGLNITVSAKGSRWPIAAERVGLPTGDTPPWQLDFKLSSSPGEWTVQDLDAKLGGSAIQGHLDIGLSGSRPRIEGKLSADRLDVTRAALWWKGEHEPTADTEPTDDAFFSKQPIKTAWMHAVDLDLEVKTGQLLTDTLVLDQADVKATLTDGALTASADAGAFGGQASGSLSAHAVGDGLQYSHRLTVKDADAGLVTARWTKPPMIEAKGGLHVEMSGNGQSVAEFMAGANGSFKLLIGEGTARAGLAERAARGLIAKMLGSLLAAEKKESVKMNCLASDVSIADGIATFDVLVLDTEHATLIGRGTADFGKETWDMSFKPHAKRASLNAAVSITMTGPFADPKVSVGKVGVLKKLAGAAGLFIFPPAAVAGLGELGSGDNVCLKLIADGTQ